MDSSNSYKLSLFITYPNEGGVFASTSDIS